MDQPETAAADVAKKPLSNLSVLLEELLAIEAQAHNLADPQGAIRAKQSEIIKGFAAAVDQLHEAFAGANIEPLIEGAKKRIADEYSEQANEIMAEMQRVVDQAKTDLVASQEKAAEQGKLIEELTARVAAIEKGPTPAPAPAA